MFGGPGIGKSTIAAAVFAELKMRGYNAEYVHEVAKDFTWERRWIALNHQPYLTAKQMFMWDRTRADVIVTDTSTLLGIVHAKDPTDAFKAWILDDYRRRNTLNIQLKRNDDYAYDPNGRRQDVDSAKAVDTAVDVLLTANAIDRFKVPVDGATVPRILRLATDQLDKMGVTRL